jgi:hypothetical protein
VAQISPKQALALGLKVDVDALPEAIVAALVAGTVDLDDPATTRALLRADAVLGSRQGGGEQGGSRPRHAARAC